MSQITLRGLDAEMEDKIRKMASNSGKSLNRVILDMIYQYTGFKKRAIEHRQNHLESLPAAGTKKMPHLFTKP